MLVHRLHGYLSFNLVSCGADVGLCRGFVASAVGNGETAFEVL